MSTMIDEFKLDRTEMTPEVHFDAGGSLLIQGRSFPEDIGAFFDPISEWMGSYVKNAASNTELRVYFEYYNSSTARRITELIFELETLVENGKDVKVTWCYKAGDAIMKENGEEIQSVVEIPFELEEVSS